MRGSPVTQRPRRPAWTYASFPPVIRDPRGPFLALDGRPGVRKPAWSRERGSGLGGVIADANAGICDGRHKGGSPSGLVLECALPERSVLPGDACLSLILRSAALSWRAAGCFSS